MIGLPNLPCVGLKTSGVLALETAGGRLRGRGIVTGRGIGGTRAFVLFGGGRADRMGASLPGVALTLRVLLGACFIGRGLLGKDAPTNLDGTRGARAPAAAAGAFLETPLRCLRKFLNLGSANGRVLSLYNINAPKSASVCLPNALLHILRISSIDSSLSAANLRKAAVSALFNPSFTPSPLISFMVAWNSCVVIPLSRPG